MDTSQVDQFGLPMSVRLVARKGGKTPTVGIDTTLTRDGLIRSYRRSLSKHAGYLPATVFGTGGATYRLLNPSDAITMSRRSEEVPGCEIGAGARPATGNSATGYTATVTLPKQSTTLDLFAGMTVTGEGVPDGATILSITGARTLTLSSATATTAGTNVALSFAGVPTSLATNFNSAIKDAFHFYTPTANGGGGNTLTLTAQSDGNPVAFQGTVKPDFTLGGTRTVNLVNRSRYVSIVTLTSGNTTQLQQGYQVSDASGLIGTVSSVLSESEFAVISGTALSSRTGKALTFAGQGAPSASYTGDIAAGTSADQMATFTYTKATAGSISGLKAGMIVAGPGVATPSTIVSAIDETAKTVTLKSQLPITATTSGQSEGLIFTDSTGAQVQLQGVIGNVQQLYASEATIATGTTKGLYAGMSVTGGALASGSFIDSISPTNPAKFSILSTAQQKDASAVPLTLAWNDSAGLEQVYKVFNFTDGTDSYQVFDPSFRTNGGASSDPIPPPWLANTTETASTMVFACDGVFADNVGQFPASHPNDSTVLGALENQLVSALNRGVATTLMSLQGQILPGSISSDKHSATLQITSSKGTAGLSAGMSVSGAGTSGGLVIQAGGTIGKHTIKVTSSQEITPFNAQELTFSRPYAAGGTWNAYAAFFHKKTVTIGGNAYGFAFDDQGGNSTDISINNPKSGQLTLGPWAKTARNRLRRT